MGEDAGRVRVYSLNVVSIAALLSAVPEGDGAVFTVRRTHVSGALSVNVEVAQGGDYTSGTGSRVVDFVDGSATATLTVSTIDDVIDESNGTITVMLVSGVGYDVGVSSSAVVGISDNDGVADPEVSIAALLSAVPEGDGAVFTVRRTNPSGALSVNVEVAQEGDWTSGTGLRVVDFVDGSATATLSVSTDDDDIAESYGRIMASIGVGVGYTVGDPGTATVVVMDDDPPVLTIAGGDAIIEGSDAVFTLTRAGSIAGSLGVTVEVTERGNFIVGSGPATISFADGEATVMLAVSTEDDAVDEVDGSVTVTIGSGMGYVVDEPSATTVLVGDDDLPGVSIAGGDAIIEGEDAVFTLTRTTSLGALTVDVDVAQVGEYVDVNDVGTQVVDFVDGESMATLTVSTTDDEVDEVDGSFTVTIESGSGYEIGDPSMATVAVVDDESPVGLRDGGDVGLYPNPVGVGSWCICRRWGFMCWRCTRFRVGGS